MANFTQSQFSMLFAEGFITDWKAEFYSVNNEWMLSFLFGSSWSYLLDVRRKQVKRFKSFDAVISALRVVGFDVTELKSCA